VREQGEIEKHYSVYFSIDCGERHGARAGGSYDGSELVRSSLSLMIEYAELRQSKSPSKT
jgi:hypothetical protein